MKKELSIASLLVLICFSVFGQNFISTDKKWNVKLTGYPNSFITEFFKIEEDSTVNTMFYNKVWISTDSLNSWTFQGLLREDSNVVYYLPPGMNEGVLYNFNLEIGDTALVKNMFSGNDEVPVSVIDIDTIVYFGVPRKRWHLGDNGFTNEYWVEGIGSLNGPLYTKYWYSIICPVWELLCFHEGDTLLYVLPGSQVCYQSTVGLDDTSNKEFNMEVFPNPVSNIITIKTGRNSVIEITNLQGQILKKYKSTDKNTTIDVSDLSNGIYLIKATSEKGILARKFMKE